MIGRLTGTVATTSADHVLLDVMGIGFVVHVSVKTLNMLPPSGETAMLWIETSIGNDSVRLYGFLSTDERAIFKSLTAIQGIGGKAALAVLGVLGADGLRQAVAAQDKTALSRVPGIGPKTVARLLTELNGKALLGEESFTSGGNGKNTAATPLLGVRADAVSALVNLGYNTAEAQRATDKALEGAPNADLSTLIRLSLREVSAA